MAYEHLIESMEESAEERIRIMMEKAYKDAEEIKRDAEAKAEMIKKLCLENASELVEVERNKLIYSGKAETKMHLTRAKDELVQKAFLEAKKKLAKVRAQNNYEDSFKRMIEEAMQELEEGEVRLHIDKRDEDLCKKILNELHVNCEIVADLDCAGGLNVSTKDERIVVLNTLESRLERAKEPLRSEMYSMLYGD